MLRLFDYVVHEINLAAMHLRGPSRRGHLTRLWPHWENPFHLCSGVRIYAACGRVERREGQGWRGSAKGRLASQVAGPLPQWTSSQISANAVCMWADFEQPSVARGHTGVHTGWPPVQGRTRRTGTDNAFRHEREIRRPLVAPADRGGPGGDSPEHVTAQIRAGVISNVQRS